MSSSSSSITTSTVNGTTRITGLASGIDVDSIVEQLMTAEKAKKLNKLQQKEQTAEWTQDAYRSIISDIQDFSSEYFDVTSSSSIMKASNFLQYASTSSDAAVTVTSASTATAGSHTVAITQLATKATLTSSASVSKEVQGSATADYSSLSDESFVMTLDGTDYTVDLSAVTDLDSLQTAVDDAVGSGKVTVSKNTSGYLEVTAADTGVQAITISATSTTDSGLSDLFGADPILSNRLSTSDTLATISDQLSTALTFTSAGEIEMTINGTALTFDQDDSLADMISTVNKADLGVTMSYNSITGELVMTADDTGAGNSLVVTDSGTSNFATLLLNTATGGKDAKLTIDGQALTRSSNTVTIDGVTYVANATTNTSSEIAAISTAKNTSDTLATAVTTYGSTTTLTDAATAALSAYTAAKVLSDASPTDTTLAATTAAALATSDTIAAAVTTYGGTTTLSTAAATAKTAYDTLVENASASDATVTVTQDTDGVYDLISAFVEDYNTLIDTINTALDENADSDYPPLTDDQKSSMTDDEITAWETKAKVGLLESDSTLSSMLSALRTALIDSVSGQTITLASIGITSGTYDEKGTLYIDEDTLTAAITSDPESIMELFTQQATSKTASGTSLAGTSVVRSLTASQLSTRYKEEGIAYRFYDTLQKNISSIRDTAGNKGTLLEKAGAEDDASDTDNTLSTLIDKYTEEIDDEQDRLDDFEENLYDKYTTLETYISNMNSQLSSLSSMTSS